MYSERSLQLCIHTQALAEKPQEESPYYRPASDEHQLYMQIQNQRIHNIPLREIEYVCSVFILDSTTSVKRCGTPRSQDRPRAHASLIAMWCLIEEVPGQYMT